MTESYKAHLIDSLRFTRETVAGNWIRGSVFLLLSLCFGFLFAFWVLQGGITVLILYVFLFIVMVGYCIRIFKGSTTSPSFAPVGTLVKDGLIALTAVWIWGIPSVICTVIYRISNSPAIYYLSIVLMILPVIGSPLIFFRFANTGKILESIRLSNIISAIHTPGWGTYLKACGIGVVCFLVLTIIGLVLHSIILLILPVGIAPPLSAIDAFFYPVFMIFTARFFTNILMNRGDNETHYSGNHSQETTNDV